MSRLATCGAFALLSTTACAPSLDHLIETRNYGEALCRATVFGEDPAELERVRAALARDARPRLHARAVTPAELRERLGERADEVAARVVLVRLRSVSNRGDFAAPKVAVGFDGERVRALPSTRDTFASLTGERLPVTTRTRDNPGYLERMAEAGSKGLGGMAAGLAETLTFGVVPVTQLTGAARGPSTTTHRPKEDDFRSAAPLAESLHDSDLVIWQRPKNEAAVDLLVTWRYEATSGDGDACVLEERAIVRLPRGDNLEQRINARFARGFVEIRPSSQPPG